MVFMDIQMPNMDGLAATSAIHTEFEASRPHIVAMTANALPGDRERYLKAGMDDYISKPFRLEDLARILSRTSGQMKGIR